MLPIHQNGAFPFYQIGVISHSEGCARENIPGEIHIGYLRSCLLFILFYFVSLYQV